MNEPIRFKLNTVGNGLLCDCNGGPNNMPVDIAEEGKDARHKCAERQLLELLQAEKKRNGMTLADRAEDIARIALTDGASKSDIIEIMSTGMNRVFRESPPTTPGAVLTGPRLSSDAQNAEAPVPTSQPVPPEVTSNLLLDGMNRNELINVIMAEQLNIKLPLQVGISNIGLCKMIVDERKAKHDAATQNQGTTPVPVINDAADGADKEADTANKE